MLSCPILGIHFIFLAFLSLFSLSLPSCHFRHPKSNFQRGMLFKAAWGSRWSLTGARDKLFRNFLFTISGVILPWHKTNAMIEHKFNMLQNVTIGQYQELVDILSTVSAAHLVISQKVMMSGFLRSLVLLRLILCSFLFPIFIDSNEHFSWNQGLT
jgi:hypothetical protein